MLAVTEQLQPFAVTVLLGIRALDAAVHAPHAVECERLLDGIAPVCPCQGQVLTTEAIGLFEVPPFHIELGELVQ